MSENHEVPSGVVRAFLLGTVSDLALRVALGRA